MQARTFRDGLARRSELRRVQLQRSQGRHHRRLGGLPDLWAVLQRHTTAQGSWRAVSQYTPLPSMHVHAHTRGALDSGSRRPLEEELARGFLTHLSTRLKGLMAAGHSCTVTLGSTWPRHVRAGLTTGASLRLASMTATNLSTAGADLVRRTALGTLGMTAARSVQTADATCGGAKP